VRWRLWLGGAAIVALVLLGVGRGFRLPIVAMGGKGLVIALIGVLVVSALLRKRPEPPR
jgi:hypothetical protein